VVFRHGSVDSVSRSSLAGTNAVAASFLGWTLDAFDFFLLVFVLKDIAQEFDTQITEVTFAILLTLAMRPIGAYLFGRAADRWGRRPTLMVDVLCYSVIEFACGFAPNLTVLLLLRAIFGIAMGGYRPQVRREARADSDVFPQRPFQHRDRIGQPTVQIHGRGGQGLLTREGKQTLDQIGATHSAIQRAIDQFHPAGSPPINSFNISRWATITLNILLKS
jgi:hypothetical protein